MNSYINAAQVFKNLFKYPPGPVQTVLVGLLGHPTKAFKRLQGILAYSGFDSGRLQAISGGRHMASKKARGVNAKTRNLKRGKGSKVSVNKLLLEIPAGAHVQVNIDSSIHSGMPHRRFQGKTGVVTGKRGRAYLMEVLQGNQSCKLIVNSAHLRVIRPVEASKAVKAEAMA